MRLDTEHLKVDNELFARNKAQLLRKLLHVAGQKRERWWYVAKVMDDAGARGTLNRTAPRDEVQYYESIVKQMARSGGSGGGGVSPADLQERVHDDIARAVSASPEDGAAGSSDIVSDDSSHDFDEQAARIVNYGQQQQQQARPRPATAMERSRPGSAGGSVRRNVHTSHITFDTAGFGAAEATAAAAAAAARPRSATPTPGVRPQSAPSGARPLSASPAPWQHRGRHTAGSSHSTHTQRQLQQRRRPGSSLSADAGGASSSSRRRARGRRSADLNEHSRRTHPSYQHRLRDGFQRRESDAARLQGEEAAVRRAAGGSPAAAAAAAPAGSEEEGVQEAQEEEDDDDTPTAGTCWHRATTAVRRCRDIADDVDVVLRLSLDPEKLAEEEVRVEESWALGEADVPARDSDVSAASDDASSGEQPDDDAGLRRKRDRQLARRDAKREEKLRRRRRAGRPPGGADVVGAAAAAPEEPPLLVTPIPLRQINGQPAPETDDPTIRLGAGAVFREGGAAQDTRERRWRPCVESLNSVEQAIQRLERCWEARQRAARGGTEGVEHPPVVSEQEKAAVIREGMGCEGDEVSALLTKWALDMDQRLKVLLMYEMIQAQGKGQPEGGGGSGGVRTEGLASTAVQTDDSLLAGAAAASAADTAAAAAAAAAAPAGGGGVGVPAGAVRKSAFSQAVFRVAAAMRVQSVYRGYAARVLVGNVRRGVLTFFHSRDARVRAAWVRGMRLQRASAEGPSGGVLRGRTAAWLVSLLGTVLNSKITANFIADSQKKPRAEFVNYLFEHLRDSLQDEGSVDDTVSALLLLLDRHVDHDLIFAVVCNFLYGIWDAPHANLLANAMCVTHAVVNKLPQPNRINPACVTDVDVYLSASQTKQVIRQVLPAKRPSAMEEVLRRCRTLDAMKGQHAASSGAFAPASAAAAAAGSSGAAGAGGGAAAGATSKGVSVTQKELFYAMLLSASPEMMVDFGYAR